MRTANTSHDATRDSNGGNATRSGSESPAGQNRSKPKQGDETKAVGPSTDIISAATSAVNNFQMKILDKSALITTPAKLKAEAVRMKAAIQDTLSTIPEGKHVSWLSANYTKSYHRTLGEVLSMAVFCDYADKHLSTGQKKEFKAAIGVSNPVFTSLKRIGGCSAIHEIGDKLPSHPSTLYRIARLTDAKLHEAIAAEVIHPKMTAKSLTPYLPTRKHAPRPPQPDALNDYELLAVVKLPTGSTAAARKALQDELLKVVEQHGYDVDFRDAA